MIVSWILWIKEIKESRMSELFKTAKMANYMCLKIESNFKIYRDLALNLDSIHLITLQSCKLNEWIARFKQNLESPKGFIYNDFNLAHTIGNIESYEFANKYKENLGLLEIEFYKIIYKKDDYMLLWRCVGDDVFFTSFLELLKGKFKTKWLMIDF